LVKNILGLIKLTYLLHVVPSTNVALKFVVCAFGINKRFEFEFEFEFEFLLDGGGSNSGQQGSGRLNDHRQQQPSGGSSNNNNGNSSAKDCSEFLLTSTDDDVFDDEEFLTSPSPTTPTDKTRRSKERIRRPMNAFMVKTLFRCKSDS